MGGGGLGPPTAPAAVQRPRNLAERSADRQRVLARHDQLMHSLVSQYGKSSILSMQATVSGGVKSADDFPSPPPMERCTAITVSELQPGMTHRGRVLRGRLITKPLLMTALTSIMEDENGDIVMVRACVSRTSSWLGARIAAVGAGIGGDVALRGRGQMVPNGQTAPNPHRQTR